MPSTLISTTRQLDNAGKQALACQACLVEALQIPAQDRLIRVQEWDSNSFFQAENQKGDYLLVEVTLFSGRSLEAKRAFYQGIAAMAEKFEISPDNTRIILYETDGDNWGIRGGQAASDVLSRKE